MTAKDPSFDTLEEPLLVQVENDADAPNSRPDANGTAPPQSSTAPPAEGESPLASPRQIRAATWAGGITGLCVGGPIGAVALAYGANHFAKKDKGDIGNFCRKTGDFCSKIGGTIKREWNEAKSGRSNEQ